MGNFQEKTSFTAKPVKEHRARGALGEKNEQLLSTIIILIFVVKKNVLYKLLPTEKNHARPKGVKKVHAPENCAIPSQNVMVGTSNYATLTSYYSEVIPRRESPRSSWAQFYYRNSRS